MSNSTASTANTSIHATTVADYSWELTLPTAYGIIGIPTLILNCWMVYIIIASKIANQNKFFYMILEMSIIDAACGLSYIMFWALRYIIYYNNLIFNFTRYGCYTMNIIFVMAGPLRQFVTMAIAIERIYAVSNPIHYKMHSGQMTGLALVVTTTASLLLGAGGYIASSGDIMYECSLPLTVNDAYAQVWTNLRNATFVLTILIYVGVIFVARSSIRRSNKVGPGITAAASKNVSEAQLRKQREMTKMVLILLAAYIGATGSSLILGQYMISASGLTFYEYYQWTMICGILDCFNCLANVFIFPLKCEDIRRVLKENLNVILCGRFEFLAPRTTTVRVAPSMAGSSLITNATTAFGRRK